MNPPADRQIFEGELATYWLEDGILVSLSKSPKDDCQHNGQCRAGEKHYGQPKSSLADLSEQIAYSRYSDAKICNECAAGCIFRNGDDLKTGTFDIHHELFIQAEAAADPDAEFHRRT